MQFPAPHPSYCETATLRRLLRAAAGAVVLSVVLLGGPAMAEEIDLLLHGGDLPVGEVAAAADLGLLSFSARHREFLGYLNQALHEDAPQNPMVRRSDLESAVRVELGDGVRMPLAVGVGLDEWEAGNRDFRVTGRGGLRTQGIVVDQRLTVVSSFAADGTTTRRSNGQLALSFDAFGGHQRAALDYDVAPLAQATAFHFESDWTFEEGGALRVGVSHRPVEAASQARVAVRQPAGPFDLSGDFAADSLGVYSVGVSLTLDLGGGDGPASWRLSDLLASLTPAPPGLPATQDLRSSEN